MNAVIHVAVIPQEFRDLSPEVRRERGVFYVNACNGRRWHPATDVVLEPWSVAACEDCQKIVAA